MKRTNRRWVAGQKVYARAVCLVCCGGLAVALSSCERKAPGPDECVAFAKVWVQPRAVAAQRSAPSGDAFEELVRDCLTKPFDRALVECVISGKQPDDCRVEYVRRVEANREERSR